MHNLQKVPGVHHEIVGTVSWALQHAGESFADLVGPTLIPDRIFSSTMRADGRPGFALQVNGFAVKSILLIDGLFVFESPEPPR